MPATIIEPRHVEATLEYHSGPEKSLEVDFTQPDGESKMDSFKKEPLRTTITDCRGMEENFTLETNGFTYAKHKVAGLENCTTDEEITALLVPATQQFVQEMLGAYKSMVITSRIRNVSQDTNKRADNRAPALSVHSDFTTAGALNAVLEPTLKATTDEAERERMAKSRVVFINVWRPLKTIKRDPLCVCDWSSIDPATDLVPMRFKFPHMWTELSWWRRSNNHRWFYLSAQTSEEPMVFVQYDSAAVKEGGKTVAHSAFVDEEYADAETRTSIEIKMAFFID
ncbi:unnamed protein product [Discula destructiva]